jgi:hypoxanthine phosphoribosyltransferase
MQYILLNDKKFDLEIHETRIQEAVIGMSIKINADFNDKTPLFIGVLNGAFLFAADLLKNIKIRCEVSFVKVSSYHGTTNNSTVTSLIGLNENIKGRAVIILEDIVDSGKTTEFLISEIKNHDPLQIKIATLLFKPKAFKGKYRPDYVGIEVPNAFLVGYGLDYNGLGRNYKDIYALQESLI